MSEKSSTPFLLSFGILIDTAVMWLQVITVIDLKPVLFFVLTFKDAALMNTNTITQMQCASKSHKLFSYFFPPLAARGSSHPDTAKLLLI